jgi:RNA polymerase sigma factor (sigma-70 family)
MLTAPHTDAELLARFAAGRDEAAFAEIVRRHGPVVLRVCRRLYRPAAEDAFQATFLVLACRAGSVRTSVGGWLVGVAGRVARQMRRRDRRWASNPPPDVGFTPRSPDLAELAAILDDELTRLPDRLRAVVVACLLAGRTHDEAAADLGTSGRTVRRRLAEAKAVLRDRLVRRGVVPTVAAAVVAGTGPAAVAVPAGLTTSTATLATDFLAGGATHVPAAIIAKGVAMGMTGLGLKAWATALLIAAVGATAVGVGWADGPAAVMPPPNPPLPAKALGRPAPPTPRPESVSVTGGSPVAARAILNEANHQLRVLSRTWLGTEPPAMRATVPINYQPGGKEGGATTFRFADGGPVAIGMKLRGGLERTLEVTLPHEMTHVVLAVHFGRAVPRWADEGMAVLAESEASRHEHDLRCRGLINAGRAIPLKELFRMTEYPKDMVVTFAQGYSVCDFLLSRHPTDGRRKLLDFVRLGMVDGNAGWERAAREVYGFRSVDDLQEQWIASLRTPPKRP